MKRELMMLGGLMGLTALAHSDVPIMAEPHEAGRRKPRDMGKPLNDPRPERKEKSSGLKRMLKSKGRK